MVAECVEGLRWVRSFVRTKAEQQRVPRTGGQLAVSKIDW